MTQIQRLDELIAVMVSQLQPAPDMQATNPNQVPGFMVQNMKLLSFPPQTDLWTYDEKNCWIEQIRIVQEPHLEILGSPMSLIFQIFAKANW